jgi:hypothetical protein
VQADLADPKCAEPAHPQATATEDLADHASADVRAPCGTVAEPAQMEADGAAGHAEPSDDLGRPQACSRSPTTSAGPPPELASVVPLGGLLLGRSV